MGVQLAPECDSRHGDRWGRGSRCSSDPKLWLLRLSCRGRAEEAWGQSPLYARTHGCPREDVWLGVPPFNSLLVARPGAITELDVVDTGYGQMGARSRLVGWVLHWSLTVGISL